MIIIYCITYGYRRPKKTYLLIEPNLSKSVIGFSITNEEQNEYIGIIANKLSKILKSNIKVISESSINNVILTKQEEIVVFNISSYYTTYANQGGHKGWITSQLYVFNPENNYSQAKYYYCVSDTGGYYWGRNNPFEQALKSSLYNMSYKFSGIMKKNVGRAC